MEINQVAIVPTNMEIKKQTRDIEQRIGQNTGQTSDQLISERKLKEMVDGSNQFFKLNNTHIQFHLLGGINKYYVEIRNSDTNEVIREVPPKKFIEMVEKMQELAGLVVDEKI